MSRTIGKMAPTATVIALVAWCCWSHLEGPGPVAGIQRGSDLPRITSALLSPAIEPAPDRDPFRPLVADKVVASQATVPVPPALNQNGATAQGGRADVLSNLVLGGTYIQGDRRLALINDQVYEQGEPLAISASITEPCIVTQISAEKVLILHRGRTMELKYPDLALKAGPPKAVEQRHE
jgi:hypothetical protein